MGKKEEALIDYNKAIEIDKKDAYTYYNRGKYNFVKQLGNLLRDLGRKEDALFDYNKTIEMNPKYANAYNNRGRCYFV